MKEWSAIATYTVVKWCLNEKVELLCNLAMLTFVARACWAPTDRGGFLETVPLANLNDVRCRFLAIVDVRFRYQAKHASPRPVKWCLNEKVELLCKLAMPRLSSGV